MFLKDASELIAPDDESSEDGYTSQSDYTYIFFLFPDTAAHRYTEASGCHIILRAG